MKKKSWKKHDKYAIVAFIRFIDSQSFFKRILGPLVVEVVVFLYGMLSASNPVSVGPCSFDFEQHLLLKMN